MANLTLQRVPLVKIRITARALGHTQILQTYFAGRVFHFCRRRGSPPYSVGRGRNWCEINRSTLMGEFEPIFLALLAQWMHEHELDPQDEVQVNQCFIDV